MFDRIFQSSWKNAPLSQKRKLRMFGSIRPVVGWMPRMSTDCTSSIAKSWMLKKRMPGRRTAKSELSRTCRTSPPNLMPWFPLFIDTVSTQWNVDCANTAGFVGRFPNPMIPSSKAMFGAPSLIAVRPRSRHEMPKRASLTVELLRIHVCAAVKFCPFSAIGWLKPSRTIVCLSSDRRSSHR